MGSRCSVLTLRIPRNNVEQDLAFPSPEVALQARLVAVEKFIK